MLTLLSGSKYLFRIRLKSGGVICKKKEEIFKIFSFTLHNPCLTLIIQHDQSTIPTKTYIYLLACVYHIILISIYLSIYLFIYPSMHPSIHPSINPSIHPSIHPSLSIYLSIYLSIIYLAGWLAVWLSIYLSNVST